MLGGRSEVFLMIYTCSSFGFGSLVGLLPISIACLNDIFFLQGSLLMMGALVLSRVLSTRLT